MRGFSSKPTFRYHSERGLRPTFFRVVRISKRDPLDVARAELEARGAYDPNDRMGSNPALSATICCRFR
jgi:hypothetical protein